MYSRGNTYIYEWLAELQCSGKCSHECTQMYSRSINKICFYATHAIILFLKIVFRNDSSVLIKTNAHLRGVNNGLLARPNFTESNKMYITDLSSTIRVNCSKASPGSKLEK